MMTDSPTPADKPRDPVQPAETAQQPGGADPKRRSYAPLFMKGCGWTLLSILLAGGVVIAGRGNFDAVAPALFGVVFLLLILSSSGLTGFWK